MKAVRLWSIRNAGWLKKCYAALEGVNLHVDLIEQVREIEGVSGVHIMAYRMEDRIGEIVSRSNALGGREPWRPAA